MSLAKRSVDGQIPSYRRKYYLGVLAYTYAGATEWFKMAYAFYDVCQVSYLVCSSPFPSHTSWPLTSLRGVEVCILVDSFFDCPAAWGNAAVGVTEVVTAKFLSFSPCLASLMWLLRLAIVENASRHQIHRNKSPSVKAFSAVGAVLWYKAEPTGGNGGGGWDWGIVDRGIINQLWIIKKKFSVFLYIEVILIYLININETRQIFRLIFMVGQPLQISLILWLCSAVCLRCRRVPVFVKQNNFMLSSESLRRVYRRVIRESQVMVYFYQQNL